MEIRLVSYTTYRLGQSQTQSFKNNAGGSPIGRVSSLVGCAVSLVLVGKIGLRFRLARVLSWCWN